MAQSWVSAEDSKRVANRHQVEASGSFDIDDHWGEKRAEEYQTLPRKPWFPSQYNRFPRSRDLKVFHASRVVRTPAMDLITFTVNPKREEVHRPSPTKMHTL